MSGAGQSRHLDRAPLTSGLPRVADIFSVCRHVSKAPTAVIPNLAFERVTSGLLTVALLFLVTADILLDQLFSLGVQMRLLILGGTQFLGRAIAVHACAMGHDVTCAARGVAGAVPSRARFIRVDRDEPDGLAPLAREEFDAVVDVSRHPGQVRRGIAALKHRVAHWTFVSTVSVYADNRTIGQRADAAPLRAPTAPEIEQFLTESLTSFKVLKF